MPYVPQTWTNNDPATPLSGPRLTAMETGIDNAHTLVDDVIADNAALVAGDNVALSYTGEPRLFPVKDGTAAAPITASGPTLKVSRTERLTRATIEAASFVGSDGSDQVAAIMGVSKAVALSETQAIGVMGLALNASGVEMGAGGTYPDACGLYGNGRVQAGGVGTGIGAFVIGRRDDDDAQACGLEVHAANYGTIDAAYNSTGFSPSLGVWINCSGNADSAAAIAVSSAGARQFEVGLAFTGAVNGAKTGGVRLVSIRDDSISSRSIHIKGTHATAAIAIDAGAGYVGIGIDTPTSPLHVVTPGTSIISALIKTFAGQTASFPALKVISSADAQLIELYASGHIRTAVVATDFPAYSNITDSDTGFACLGSNGAAAVTGGVMRQRWADTGTQIGPTLALGGGTGVVGITNASVVPTTNPSGGGVLYSEAGALKWRSSAGTVTTIAPV